MTFATGVMWIFAALLGLAGARKIASPGATGAALQGARLPSDPRLVRLLGAGELLLAAGVLLIGGPIAAGALAATYAAFAVFTSMQFRRGAGCGCFGDAEIPATGLHIAVDALGAVAAAVAAVGLAPSVPALVTQDDVVTGLLAVALLGLGTVAVLLTLTALPELAVATAQATDRDRA